MQKISRSKIELAHECPRCFWLDLTQKIKRPPPAPYTINNAIDYLLKQEFDVHREAGTPHPIMKKNHIDAVPFQSPLMNKWRHNFTGVQFEHAPTDFLVYGAVDDVWVNPKGQIMVVDYKATGANQHKIYDSYERQMEIYQWLLTQNKYDVLNTGYFVFAKVNKAGGFEKASLSFDLILEPCECDNSWVEQAIHDARKIFDSKKPPAPGADCKYCAYGSSVSEFAHAK